MVNNFRGEENKQIPPKIYLRLSIPIMVVLVIPNFLVRLIIELFDIYTGLITFGLVHIVIIFMIHLKIFQKGTIQEKTGNFYDFYSQNVQDYTKVNWVLFSVALTFQMIRIFESIFDTYIITQDVEENYLFTFIVLGFCYLFTSLINKIVDEKKRIQGMALKLSSLLSFVSSLLIWGLVITLYSIIMQKAPFEIHGFSILILLYLSSFLLFGKIISKRENKRIETELLQEFDNKANVESKTKKEEKKVILSVRNLVTYFYTEEGVVKAVEGVSFDIFNEEILGLVGETGCGKSVTALSILRLVRSPGKIIKGSVIFEGEDLLQKTEDEMLKFRGNQITMMFQDPLNSINPVFKVGEQISEVYLLHKEDELTHLKQIHGEKINEFKSELTKVEQQLQKPELTNNDKLLQQKRRLEEQIQSQLKYTSTLAVAREKGIDLLRDVGIPDPEQVYNRYPHELSGGMRQRVMIAMGLACSPKLLLADEPTTALDVTIQAQILDLISELRKKYHTSVMFITHDLGIISQICDRVAVMYSGYIVEYGNVRDIFAHPKHPYTQGLIKAIPKVGMKKDKLMMIPGSVPNLVYPPSGCRFHPRCQHRFDPCDKITPKQIEVEPNYFVSCHLFDPLYSKLEAKE